MTKKIFLMMTLIFASTYSLRCSINLGATHQNDLVEAAIVRFLQDEMNHRWAVVQECFAESEKLVEQNLSLSEEDRLQLVHNRAVGAVTPEAQNSALASVLLGVYNGAQLNPPLPRGVDISMSDHYADDLDSPVSSIHSNSDDRAMTPPPFNLDLD